MAKDRRIGEAGHTSAVNPVLRTGLVAAILAGALAVVGCSTSSACTAGASCAPPPVPRLTYVLTINGQSVSFPKNGTTPIYHVRLGEHLLITVAVIVPRHLTTTALWLGISTDTWGNGPKGRPIGMHPILSHTRHPQECTRSGCAGVSREGRVLIGHSASSWSMPGPAATRPQQSRDPS